MVQMAASHARDNFSNTLNLVAYAGERVILERHGKAVAAIVSAEDLELLQALEDRADLADARAALEEGGSIPFEDLKASLGL